MTESEKPRGGPGGRYELREKVGEGGSGTVFRAWDTQLQRFVAFKRLKAAESLDEPDLLLKEAKTLAALQHPNLLTVFDCGEDEQGPFVVTEFLEGVPLSDYIKKNRYQTQSICEAIVQTLEGLVAAHHLHIIHRDLKPSNIMVVTLPSDALQYKILDFGLARLLTQPTAQTMHGADTIHGSIHYLAPEQIRHHPIDARTDLYALGCVYYTMLTGHPAFQGDSIVDVLTAHIEHRMRSLTEERPDIPLDLCQWIMRLMSREPDDRPASAKEALESFRPVHARLAQTRTIRIAPSTTVRPTPPIIRAAPSVPPDTLTRPIALVPEASARRRRAVRLAAGLLLAAGLAVGLVVTHPWSPAPPASSVLAPPPVAPPARDYFADMDRPDVLRGYYNQIKDLDFDFGSLGSVGEALALATFRARYASDTNIECMHGLHYEGTDGSTAGELDLVVWRRDRKQAIAVFEVKVSDSLPSALDKAHSQLHRFQGHVRSRAITRFNYPDDDARIFRPEQFDAVETYGVIGSQGAAAAGYDVELDLSRAEAVQLQKAILYYKKSRQGTSRVVPARGERAFVLT